MKKSDIPEYLCLTDRIISVVNKHTEITPTEVAKILDENIQNVSSTMFYLYKKGVFQKRKERRFAYYSTAKK